MIDPRAIIDPSAEIGGNVEIGPYAIIGARVSIDEDTWIGPHAVIKGPTQIGKTNKIYQFTSIGEDPQDKKYGGETTHLIIGDGNIFREACTVHRGTAQDQGMTRIGDDNLFMAYTHVAHDCMIGNHVVMANAASLAGHVHLHDYVTLGGFSLVHQFSKIGTYVFSAMGSTIARDVPPYVMVGGVPTQPHGINVIGLERNGFQAESIRLIRKAYKIIFKEGLTLEAAFEELSILATDHQEIVCIVDFLKQSQRGILR